MHCFVLQDWITVRGQSLATPPALVQTEQGWLDMTPYQDVFFWVDVREVNSGTAPTIAFETSPAPDDSLFQAVLAAAPMQAGNTPTIVKAPMNTATVPIARFLRWKVQGPASTLWEATFRVLVAANSPGM